MIRRNFEWLFAHNNESDDFINFIMSIPGRWSEIFSNLIQNLRNQGAIGLQEKFQNIGFNRNNSLIQLKSLFYELEVGYFLLSQGERVRFMERQHSPDLISGDISNNKIWEISSIFDSVNLKRLLIEGHEIIRSWDINVTAHINLSLNLSGFLPNANYHEYHRQIVDESLNQLRSFDPDLLKTNRIHILNTPNIRYELSLSDKNFSGNATVLEGGLEGRAYLVPESEEIGWINALRNRILNKSEQLINNIRIYEQSRNIPWDSNNYRLIAIVIGSDVWPDENIFLEACFGLFRNHNRSLIRDTRIDNLAPNNPWYEYLNELCSFYGGLNWREPRGAFLLSRTKKIHGVLFITTNRIPNEYYFVANPFVLVNNDPSIINILKKNADSI